MRSRRSAPRLWDTDWLVLRPLARLLVETARAHVPPGALLLDYGCGDMPYAADLAALGLDYRGADIDADGAGSKLEIAADGRVPLADGAAGAVLSVQVLEHVADLAAYFAEIRRLLAEDGVLILSTHGTWLYHPHPGDYRRWTRTGLILELESHGFAVQSVSAIAGPLATTTLIRLTGFAYVARKLPLLGGALAGLLAVVMNLRARLEDAVTPRAMREDNASVYLVRAGKAR